MEKLFENINGNQFKLISEGVEENEPKSSLIRKGLRKVFSEGEKEYSYKKLQGVGLGYIRNISEAKKCALQEARELALEFGYEDQEQEQKFVKELGGNPEDVTKPEEKMEVVIAKRILLVAKQGKTKADFSEIAQLAQQLIEMHSPDGPVVKPGTGPTPLYKHGSIY